MATTEDRHKDTNDFLKKVKNLKWILKSLKKKLMIG